MNTMQKTLDYIQTHAEKGTMTFETMREAEYQETIDRIRFEKQIEVSIQSKLNDIKFPTGKIKI